VSDLRKLKRSFSTGKTVGSTPATNKNPLDANLSDLINVDMNTKKGENLFKHETNQQNMGTTATDPLSAGPEIELEYNYYEYAWNGYRRNAPPKNVKLNADYGTVEDQGILDADTGKMYTFDEYFKTHKKEEIKFYSHGVKDSETGKGADSFINEDKPFLSKLANKVSQAAKKIMGKKA